MSHATTDLADGQSVTSRFALERDRTVLLVVDVQERLGAAMDPAKLERMVKNTRLLIESAKVLGIPVFATEQYPKGLGPTVSALRDVLPADVAPIDKLAFSCGAVKEVARRLFQSGRRQVVIAGMETHICVFQTVRDLAAGGYQPFVARDAVLSRTAENHETGLQLMRESGATITSTETVVYDLLGAAGTPEFKQIAPMMK
jgi:nicotinamidase-related amidase